MKQMLSAHMYIYIYVDVGKKVISAAVPFINEPKLLEALKMQSCVGMVSIGSHSGRLGRPARPSTNHQLPPGAIPGDPPPFIYMSACSFEVLV